MPRSLISTIIVLCALQSAVIAIIPDVPHAKTAHHNLHRLEWDIFNRTVHKYREMNINIEVFYHASMYRKYWKDIILEQLDLLDGWQHVRNGSHGPFSRTKAKTPANIMSVANKVNILLHGNMEQVETMKNAILGADVSYKNKMSLSSSPTIDRGQFGGAKEADKSKIREEALKNNQTAGEYQSITNLFNYCKKEVSEGRNSVAVYFHTKGAHELKGGGAVADWRDEMNAFVIEFPSICMRALTEGYSACGPNYQDGHFSGNFWWASCNHVAKLKGLWDPINNAWDAEFFVLNVPNANEFSLSCAYRPFACQINNYNYLCPRTEYSSVIFYLIRYDDPYIQNDPLPTLGFNGQLGKPTEPKNPKIWNKRPCLSAKSNMTDVVMAELYHS